MKAPGKKQAAAQPEKRGYFKQSDFPLVTLEQAQKIASALVDNFGGTRLDYEATMKLLKTFTQFR